MKIIKEIDKIIESCEELITSDIVRAKIVNQLITLQEYLDLEVRCAICNDKISNPRVGQVVCNKEECQEEYYKFKQEEWKNINLELKNKNKKIQKHL